MSPEAVLAAPIRVSTNAATLLIGNTGSGKSAQIAMLAEYVKDVHNKSTRLYTADGGGWPGQVEKLIRFGVIEVWRMRTRSGSDLAFETIQRATEGYWPATIKKLSGECPNHSPLLPPIFVRWQAQCVKCGKQTKEVASQSALGPHQCPHCKTMLTSAQLTVRKVVKQHPAFAHVGAVVFEGLTSMGNWAMEDIATRQGKGELQGEKSALGGVVRSGDIVLGSTNRAHVGFAQNRQHEWVGNSNGIPNLVVPPVWTALTLETTDEGGLSVLGPRLEGRAATDQAPAWFGNCIEALQTKTEKGERQFHLFLSEFIDEAGRRHLIKNRAEPGRLPMKLSDPPLQEDEAGNITNAEVAFTQANLGLFFRLLDQALTEGVAAGREKYGEPTVVDDSVTDWTGGEPQVAPTPVVKRTAVGAPSHASPAAQGPTTSPATSSAPTSPPAPAGVAIKPRVAIRKAVKPKVVEQAEQQAQKPVGAQLRESVAAITEQDQAEAAQAAANGDPHPLDGSPLTPEEPPLPMDPPATPVSSPPLTVAPPTATRPGQPKAWAPPVRRVPPKPPA